MKKKPVEIIKELTPSDKERFWAKVDIRSEEDCWEWKDAKNDDGYGHISIGSRENQRKLAAHRVAKTLSMGEEIPPGMFVMHMCDNPPCCNPGHLVIGTHQENMDDMVAKKRAAKSFGNAKLDWETIDNIRSSEKSGNQLAREMGLAKSTISAIRNNKTWREEHRNVSLLPN